MYNDSSIPTKRQSQLRTHRNPRPGPSSRWGFQEHTRAVFAEETGTLTYDEWVERNQKKG